MLFFVSLGALTIPLNNIDSKKKTNLVFLDILLAEPKLLVSPSQYDGS